MLRTSRILFAAVWWFACCASVFASPASHQASFRTLLALYDDSGPQQVTIQSTTPFDHVTKYTFQYIGAHNALIDAYAYVPNTATAASKAPCLLLIHGLGGDKEMMEPVAQVLAAMGYSSIMIDQAGQGARATVKGIPPFATEADLVNALRGGSITTVVDLRRAIDAARYIPGIDDRRIGVVGYSMGALVGTVLGGVDTRVSAVVLMSAGADIAKILEDEAAGGKPLGGYYAALITTTSLSTLHDQLADVDPANFVGHIAPRPLLMLNGRKDSIIAPDRAQALYDAAGAGKQIVWYDDAGHILPCLRVYADMSVFLKKNFPAMTSPAV